METFLSHLASVKNVAASTQRQALNALVFLYRDVLQLPFEHSIASVRAKCKRQTPTVTPQVFDVLLSERTWRCNGVA